MFFGVSVYVLKEQLLFMQGDFGVICGVWWLCGRTHRTTMYKCAFPLNYTLRACVGFHPVVEGCYGDLSFFGKMISRAKGHSAVAAAAYRAGETLQDERQGVTQDYARKTQVAGSWLLVPDHAPAWTQDRAALWNAVEAAEQRKDAQLARELVVALPRDIPTQDHHVFLLRFVQEQFVDKGMIADVSLHDTLAADGGRNPHAHILLTLRKIEADGFGLKERSWNRKDTLKGWREAWAKAVNDALAEHGSSGTIDHRTLAAQGIERAPSVHMGKEATAMERKGLQTRRGKQQQVVQQWNNHFQINRFFDWQLPDHIRQQQRIEAHYSHEQQHTRGIEIDHG